MIPSNIDSIKSPFTHSGGDFSNVLSHKPIVYIRNLILFFIKFGERQKL